MNDSANERNSYDTNLSPIIELIRVVRKNNLQKVAGSLKIKIPTSTIPTAPIPVHTAYEVPTGNVWAALYNKYMLTARQVINPKAQKVVADPVDSFNLPIHVANPTSNIPAMISMIQFICRLLYVCDDAFQN